MYQHYHTIIMSPSLFQLLCTPQYLYLYAFATIFVKSKIKRLCKTVNIGVGSLYIYSNNINTNCVPLTVRFSSFIQSMRNRGYKMTNVSPVIAMVDAIISIKNLPWPIRSYLLHSLTWLSYKIMCAQRAFFVLTKGLINKLVRVYFSSCLSWISADFSLHHTSAVGKRAKTVVFSWAHFQYLS